MKASTAVGVAVFSYALVIGTIYAVPFLPFQRQAPKPLAAEIAVRSDSVGKTMREIGVCLWRDILHQEGRDDVWARDPKFRADLSSWCGKEPSINVFPPVAQKYTGGRCK